MNILDKLHERYSVYIENALEKYLTINIPIDFKDTVLYQIRTGGKRVRPIITLLFSEACGGRIENALPSAVIVELIHNYSLIYDDIIDRSIVRRKQETVWKKFGFNIAILVGIWYREAIEHAVLNTPKPEIFAKEVAYTIQEITDGERLDILLEVTGREDPYIIENKFVKKLSIENVDELERIYFKMIEKKTATLFKTSAKFGVLSVTDNELYVKIAEKYGHNIGIAFQLIDDLLDIFGEFKKFGKEIGKDLKEHKLGNAIVVYSLKELPTSERKFVIEVLSKERLSDDDIKTLVEIFDKTNARNIVIEKAKEFMEKAIEDLDKLPVKEKVTELIELAKFIVYREY